MDLVQEKRNERRVVISLSEEEWGARPDRLRVTAWMRCMGEDYPVFEKSFMICGQGDGKGSSPSGGGDFHLEVPYFGCVFFELFLTRGDDLIAHRQKTIHVTADEYYIAPLIASVPVLLFGLKYFSDLPKTTAAGDPIPTVITFSRGGDPLPEELPEHMTVNPYLREEDRGESDFDMLDMQMPKIASYVQELNRGNRRAKFTFFLNDSHLHGVLTGLLWKCGIPGRRRILQFISDGGKSELEFGMMYNWEKTDARKMFLWQVKELIRMRILAAKGKDLPFAVWPWRELERMVWPLLRLNPTARWWVMNRFVRYKANHPGFLRRFRTHRRVWELRPRALWEKVKEEGNLPALHRFLRGEDEVFRRIEEEGRIPVLILGGGPAAREEKTMPVYLKMLSAFLDERHVLVYKKHPGREEGTIDLLRESTGLRLEEADTGAFPEVLLWEHPGAMLAGYASTTFAISGCEDRYLALFGQTGARAESLPETASYAQSIPMFFAFPGMGSDGSVEGQEEKPVLEEPLAALLGDYSEDVCMVELRDHPDHDLGLWEADMEEVSLYRKKEGRYRVSGSRPVGGEGVSE